MILKLYSPPAVEPVSLQELKEHLRLDSGSFGDNVTTYQCLAPASRVVAADYVTHVGTGVDVLGYQAVVNLVSGTNQAGGTVDAKIQESDDNITFTDVTSGAFTQVTVANDNAIQEKAYTGNKQYIRVVAKVLVAACVFGVDILKYSGDTTEDDILTAIITSAREKAEAYLKRVLITQTWDGWLDEFPEARYFQLPFGQVQSVTALDYTDSAGTNTVMTLTTDYLVDDDQDPGRIVLPYSAAWPSGPWHPVNPIHVRWICGYGAAASDVPASIRTAVKMLAADLYSERGEKVIGNFAVIENDAAKMLLYPYRFWSF